MSQNQVVTVSARLPRPQGAEFITPAQWRLATNVVWPTAMEADVIANAWTYCMARKLDPLKRPVHIVKVYSKQLKRMAEGIWPGIGELETTASRSNAWVGMDPPIWGPMVEQTFTGTADDDAGGKRNFSVTVKYPDSCTVPVWRMVKGVRYCWSEPVFWLETYSRMGFRSEVPTDMWQKRPRGQLHKCAKAAGLRAAFPEDLGGQYASDEMEGREVDAPNSPYIDGVAEYVTAPPVHGKHNGRPEYPMVLPSGKHFTAHTGTEFLTHWRSGIDFMRTQRPDLLPGAAEANRDTLAVVANFDPEAAAEVEGLLAAALAAAGGAK